MDRINNFVKTHQTQLALTAALVAIPITAKLAGAAGGRAALEGFMKYPPIIKVDMNHLGQLMNAVK